MWENDSCSKSAIVFEPSGDQPINNDVFCLIKENTTKRPAPDTMGLNGSKVEKWVHNNPFLSNFIDKEYNEIKIRTYDGVIGAPEDSSDCQNSKREYDLQESKFE